MNYAQTAIINNGYNFQKKPLNLSIYHGKHCKENGHFPILFSAQNNKNYRILTSINDYKSAN